LLPHGERPSRASSHRITGTVTAVRTKIFWCAGMPDPSSFTHTAMTLKQSTASAMHRRPLIARRPSGRAVPAATSRTVAPLTPSRRAG
jgi:hypothetical protein